jgi:putative glutamine amidotransferase
VNNCSNAPERDVFEKALVEKSMAIHLPLLGVCRGMQLLNHQFDGQCSKVQNHAGTTHPLKSLTYDLEFPSEVNSFHHWGIAMEELASDLIPLAVDTHGYVEAMKHREANIYGIMWHPERDKTFQSENIELLKAIFL